MAWNRWQKYLEINFDLSRLNDSVLADARALTTTLSANVIECVTAGHADERMLSLIDGIMTGVPTAEECADLALSFGNSSGIDTLAGMMMAVNYVRLS